MLVLSALSQRESEHQCEQESQYGASQREIECYEEEAAATQSYREEANQDHEFIDLSEVQEMSRSERLDEFLSLRERGIRYLEEDSSMSERQEESRDRDSNHSD